MQKNIKPNFKVKHPYSYLIQSILLGIVMLFTGVFSAVMLDIFRPNSDVDDVNALTEISANVYGYNYENPTFNTCENLVMDSNDLYSMGSFYNDGYTCDFQVGYGNWGDLENSFGIDIPLELFVEFSSSSISFETLDCYEGGYLENTFLDVAGVLFVSCSYDDYNNGDVLSNDYYYVYINLHTGEFNGDNVPSGHTIDEYVSYDGTTVTFNTIGGVYNPLGFRSMMIEGGCLDDGSIMGEITTNELDWTAYIQWMLSSNIACTYTYAGSAGNVGSMPPTFGPTGYGTATGDGTSGLTGNTIVGDVSVSNPYKIYSWYDFEYLANIVGDGKHFSVMNDLAVNATSFRNYTYSTSAWSSTYTDFQINTFAFNGYLHGNGHTITINNALYSEPLFHQIVGVVRDLTIKINSSCNSTAWTNKNSTDSNFKPWTSAVLAYEAGDSSNKYATESILIENINVDLGNYFVMRFVTNITYNTDSPTAYHGAVLVHNNVWGFKKLTFNNCNIKGDVHIWNTYGYQFGVFLGRGYGSQISNSTYTGTFYLYKEGTNNLFSSTSVYTSVSSGIGYSSGAQIERCNFNMSVYLDSNDITSSSYGYNSSYKKIYISPYGDFPLTSFNSDNFVKNCMFNCAPNQTYYITGASANCFGNTSSKYIYFNTATNNASLTTSGTSYYSNVNI